MLLKRKKRDDEVIVLILFAIMSIHSPLLRQSGGGCTDTNDGGDWGK